LDKVLLERLATYDFRGKNETAVREQWIYPLLDLLGYGAHTLDDVLFEERLALRQPLQRLIGSRTLKVDYRPTVLGKHLWLVEAKAPAKDERQADSDRNLGQAWTYATHPEVNVPLIVLANGQRIRVHDVSGVDWERPILDLTQSDLLTRFDELVAVLGPRVVAEKVRQRQFVYLKAALEAELDPAVCDSVVAQVRRLAEDAKPVILENQRRIRQHQSKLDEAKGRQILAGAGSWAVAQEHNIPLGFSLNDVSRAAQVVLDREPDQRAAQLEMYVQATRFSGADKSTWRPFWSVRALRLWVALRVRREEGCQDAANEIIGTALPEHLGAFATDPLLQAFHRWEQVVAPAVLRSLVLKQHDALLETERKRLTTWDMERVLRAGVDPHRSALGATMLTCRVLWQRTSTWSARDYAAATAQLQELLASTDDELARSQPPATAFLDEYVLGQARSSRPEDDLITYAILAVDAEAAQALVPPEYEPVVAAAAHWPGAVAEAARRLMNQEAN
jgi:hypothetical protein